MNIRYEDYVGLIRKLAWKFSKGNQDRLKELVAEGNLQFCICLRNYDPERGKFSTFLWGCIHKRFCSIVQVKPVFDDFTEEFDPEVERNLIFRDSVNSLSDMAKAIVQLVFETPGDFYSCVEEEIKLNRRMITDYLRKKGWRFQDIWDSYSEIAEMLVTIK